MKIYYCPQGHKCQESAEGICCPECQEKGELSRWSPDALLKLGGSIEENGARRKLYAVYAYPIGVAKIPEVLAASPEKAIDQAESEVDWRRCFDGPGRGDVELWDFTESFEAFTVYEPTGPDAEQAHFFLGDGKTRLAGDVTNVLIRFLEIAPALYGLLDKQVRTERGAEFFDLHQQLKGLLRSAAPHLIERNKVYYCPQGHRCEDRTALDVSVNRGIYCHICRDWRTCPNCGWIGTRHQVTCYLSNTQAYKQALLRYHNPLDGGVYGLCPACENGLVHGQGGWWLDETGLLHAGGSVERD